MQKQETDSRSSVPEGLVKPTVAVPVAVIVNADRIAQAADCDAEGVDVIREVLVGQLCQVTTQEGSYADRCTAPADRIESDRVKIGEC